MRNNTTIFNPQKYPLLMPSIALTLGIVFQTYFSFPILIVFSLIPIVYFINLVLDRLTPLMYKKIYWQSAIIGVIFFSLGALRTYVHSPKNQPGHIAQFLNQIEQNIEIKGVVTEIELGNKSYKIGLRLEEINYKNNWVKMDGKTILYCHTLPDELNLFDEIQVKADRLPVLKPNPYAFDYQLYLERKDIFFTAYVKDTTDISVTSRNKKSINDWPLSIRYFLDHRLNEVLGSNQAYSLTTAMLLGQRSKLDERTISVFSNTGAIHVLAVSGLHVGILVHILYLVMGFFKLGSKPKLIISITVGFIYAVVVGAAPSIIRASILISLILIGNHYKSYINIYNLLSLIALIMLTIDPNDFFSMSFQFSFTAILSLALFTKPIYELVTFKYKIPQILWKLLSATLAAQVLMTPLVMYYFHQFPTYFFLSCFVAIPLAYIGVLGGGGLLLMSFLLPESLINVGANVYNWIIDIAYFLLEKMDGLPFSKFGSLFLSLPALVLVIAFILCCYYYILSKRRTYLFVCNALLVILITNELIDKAKDHKQLSMTVYNMRMGTLVDFFDGFARITYQSQDVDTQSELFASENNRLEHHVSFLGQVRDTTILHSTHMETHGKIIKTSETKIQIIDESDELKEDNNCHLIIVSISILQFPKLENKFVVFGNGVNFKTKKMITENCLNCQFWDVKERGYFLSNLH